MEMGEERLVLLHPCCPAPDDSEMRELLEVVARAAGSEWARLVLTVEECPDRAEYVFGTPAPDPVRLLLRLPSRFTAELELADGASADHCRPLIEVALRAVLEHRRLEEEAALMRGALDTTTAAVLLFDDSGAIVYANPGGDRLLAEQTESGLSLIDPDASPLVTHLCERVEQVFWGSGSPPSWRGVLPVSDGSLIACEVLRVESSGGAAGVLALIQAADLMPERRLESFSRTHRLSRREQEVVRLLVEGLDTTTMADRLSISRHTVRDHLKHLYRKTGTRSRGELVGLITGAVTAGGPSD